MDMGGLLHFLKAHEIPLMNMNSLKYALSKYGSSSEEDGSTCVDAGSISSKGMSNALFLRVVPYKYGTNIKTTNA